MNDHPEHDRPEPTTLAEAYQRLAEVEEDIAAIRAKIDRAKADKIITGQYSDPDWFARVNAALRFKGMEHQRLQRIAGRLARQERAASARRFEQAFVDQARKVLKPDTFAAIIDRARASLPIEDVTTTADTAANNS